MVIVSGWQPWLWVKHPKHPDAQIFISNSIKQHFDGYRKCPRDLIWLGRLWSSSYSIIIPLLCSHLLLGTSIDKGFHLDDLELAHIDRPEEEHQCARTYLVLSRCSCSGRLLVDDYVKISGTRAERFRWFRVALSADVEILMKIWESTKHPISSVSYEENIRNIHLAINKLELTYDMIPSSYLVDRVQAGNVYGSWWWSLITAWHFWYILIEFQGTHDGA